MIVQLKHCLCLSSLRLHVVRISICLKLTNASVYYQFDLVLKVSIIFVGDHLGQANLFGCCLKKFNKKL